MNIEKALKTIGDWISRETELRKYPKGELLELSESLKTLKVTIARQSATSEEVAEAIEVLSDPMEWVCGDYVLKDQYDKASILAIATLQAYQPWVSVSERLSEGDVASVLIHTDKGGVSEGQYYPSIKSWKQFRWSVENADVTHWKPLPEPPKGE